MFRQCWPSFKRLSLYSDNQQYKIIVVWKGEFKWEHYKRFPLLCTRRAHTFLLFIRVRHLSAKFTWILRAGRKRRRKKKGRKINISFEISPHSRKCFYGPLHISHIIMALLTHADSCILYHQIFNGEKKHVGSLWLPIWTVKCRQEIRCRANRAEPRIQGFPPPFWRRNFFRFFHHRRTWLL